MSSKLPRGCATLPLLAGLLALGACDDVRRAIPRPPEPPEHGDPPEAPEPPIVRRNRPLMGTQFQVVTVGVTEQRADGPIQAAFEEIARLEGLLSEWQPTSDISRINAAAGGSAVRVGPEAIAVVRTGVEISRWSDGAFDLSWAAMRGLYMFRPGEEYVPTQAEIRARVRLVNYREIVLDETASTVRLRRRGMALGTGGIARGYALDRAGEIFERNGITNYMIFAGGLVKTHGTTRGRPWRVAIGNPRRRDAGDPENVATFDTTDGAVATTTDAETSFTDASGRRWHDIIDPSTGYPADRTVAVTVRSRDAMHADALSTAVFVMGPERAMERLATAPGAPELFIVSPTLHVSGTASFLSSLRYTRPLREDGRLPE